MIKFFITALFVILIFACQPRPMTRATNQVPVDSALFFEQRSVTDEFIAQTDGNADQLITLKVERYPPPEEEPLPSRFREVEGFRVQAFAGLDSLSVYGIAESLRDIVLPDSIYVFHDRGLFKVQIGDFLYRPQADAMRTQLQQNGYAGAWVIKRQILIPAEPDSSTGRYKIQIAATLTEENANNMIQKARLLTSSDLFYEKSENYYKVFIGYFRSEDVARDVLGKIRQAGFPDAWLVY